MSAQAEATVKLSLIDRITNPIKKISARLSNLGKRIGFDRITRSVGNLGRSISGLGTGLVRTTGRLTAFLGVLGAGGAGVIASAYGLAKSVADIGGEIDDTANRLKIGIEALQEWRYVAKLSGVENASFDKGVEKLGINAVAAAKGNKQLASAFRSVGVRVKDAHGKMRPIDDVLDATMAALAGIKDPLKQNAMAFQLFGKSGVVLTQMMADGAGGMKDLRTEARRLGIVLGTSAVKAGAEFGDQTDRLAVRLTGLKYLVGAQLLPVFNNAIQALTDWYDANKVLIRSTLTGWVKNLVSVIKSLAGPTSNIRQQFSKFGETVSGLVDKIKPFVDFAGGPMNAALGLIGLWVLAPAISAVALLAIAFAKLGTAIASVGISTIAAAVKGLGSLFSGMGGTAETSGAAAGRRYGGAFSKSLRGAVRLGLAGLGVYAASQIISDMPTTKEGWEERFRENKKADEGRNKTIMDSGGSTLNKLLGFNFLREKDDYANSPAKKLLDGLKSLIPESKPIVGTQAVQNAAAAKSAGFGLGTTETSPGKAADDYQAAVTIPQNMIVHEPKTTSIDASVHVGAISIQGGDTSSPRALAKAIDARLGEISRRAALDASSRLGDQ